MSVTHWISILCSLSILSSHPQNSAILPCPLQPQGVILYSLMVSMRHPSQYAHVFENLTPILGRMLNLSETNPCWRGCVTTGDFWEFIISTHFLFSASLCRWNVISKFPGSITMPTEKEAGPICSFSCGSPTLSSGLSHAIDYQRFCSHVVVLSFAYFLLYSSTRLCLYSVLPQFHLACFS